MNELTYQQAIKAKVVYPIFQLLMLYPDDTVSQDVTDDLLQGGTLSINLQNGTRRSLSLSLINKNKKWILNHNTQFWIRTKFQLNLGLMINGQPYYQPAGVFYIYNPELVSNLSEQVTNCSFVDKFAMLDNTLSGAITEDMSLSVGTSVADAIRSLLNMANDPQAPLIDPKFETVYISTEIRKLRADGKALADFISDLSSTYNFNYYYNIAGTFVVEDASADIDDSIKPSIWDFTTEEYEYLGSTLTCNSSDIYNEVLVTSSNSSSDTVYYGIAINDDLTSEFNIYNMEPRLKTISSDTISSDEDAYTAAQVALKRYCIMQKTIKLSSTYMCHLDVNNIITVQDDQIDLNKNRFLIKSISLPISTDCKISLDCTDTNDYGKV